MVKGVLMKNANIHKAVGALLLGSAISLLSGCFDDEPKVVTLPEVNDANCTPAVIKSIEPQSARQKFSGECSRRGAVRTSPAKEW